MFYNVSSGAPDILMVSFSQKNEQVFQLLYAEKFP